MELATILAVQAEWEAEAREESLLERLPDLAYVAAWLALAAFALCVLLALLRRRRYRAVDLLDEAAHGRLAAAITAAERRSRGELAVVVLERADRHPAAEWIAGVTTAALGSAALAVWLPWERPVLLLACQLGLGALGFLAARMLADFKRRFVSEARADEMSEEQAVQEFHVLGLQRTAERTGVLILVCLFERRVVVLGDAGIDALVPADHWTATSEAVLAGVRAGELERGLVEGVGRCAALLEERFPRDDSDVDELPDHVVVRRE